MKNSFSKRQVTTFSTCIIAAIAVGHFVQFGMSAGERNATPTPRPAQQVSTATLVEAHSLLAAVRRAGEQSTSDVTPTLPSPPPEAVLDASLQVPSLGPQSPSTEPHADVIGLGTESRSSDQCAPVLEASPQPGALVGLSTTAPCAAEQIAEIRHGALRFDIQLDKDGSAVVSVPALASPATFTLSLDSGETVEAELVMPDVAHFERVVLQSAVGSGLSIHALEFGARPGTSGHISPQNPKAPMRAVRAFGGFLTSLGTVATAGAARADVYTFPSRTTRRDGVVRLQIEAAVTEQNCGQSIVAEAIQSRDSGGHRHLEVAVDMPACSEAGTKLLLKNILQDLKIASN